MSLVPVNPTDTGTHLPQGTEQNSSLDSKIPQNTDDVNSQNQAPANSGLSKAQKAIAERYRSEIAEAVGKGEYQKAAELGEWLGNIDNNTNSRNNMGIEKEGVMLRGRQKAQQAVIQGSNNDVDGNIQRTSLKTGNRYQFQQVDHQVFDNEFGADVSVFRGALTIIDKNGQAHQVSPSGVYLGGGRILVDESRHSLYHEIFHMHEEYFPNQTEKFVTVVVDCTDYASRDVREFISKYISKDIVIKKEGTKIWLIEI